MDELTEYIGKHRARELTMAEEVTQIKIDVRVRQRAKAAAGGIPVVHRSAGEEDD